MTWELSADGGVNWQTFLPDTNWYAFDFPGTDLRWRSILTLSEVNPTVSDLAVSWVGQAVTPVPESRVSPRFALHVALPNPFNPQTTIAFELPQQEAVSLRVHDVAGRLVKVLVDHEVYGQGRHEATWNGRNSFGKFCPSGTYFYRLQAGDYVETKRMTLLK